MRVPPPPPTVAAGCVAPQRFERLLAGFVAVAGCVVFSIAAVVNPYDESGNALTHGTHRQLGLPPCTLLSLVGFPCPACGMTTAVSLLVHGDPVASYRANGAGTLIAGAGLVTTAWLGMLAWGVRRRPRFSAENSILGLTIAGAGVAIVRYICLVVAALAGGAP